MRIRRVNLIDFKRFDNLTIDLSVNPKKIVAMVGPNGCGKSAVFDALEAYQRQHKGSNNAPPNTSFYYKALYREHDPKTVDDYKQHEQVFIDFDGHPGPAPLKLFYQRSAYRFTPQLNIESLTSQQPMLKDLDRPASSIGLDQRLAGNYQRLHSYYMRQVRISDKSGKQVLSELIGTLNSILSRVLDITISDLGDIVEARGQLYFAKDTSLNFPYANLSAGEKEVVDIIIDLFVKREEFNDTVYTIDEPELHLNTKIQRQLLIEVNSLIPDNCQLWVATHSIGFLRALQDELADNSQVLDFAERDYFNGAHTIRPMQSTRHNWQRVFQTALEDLTGLLAPKRVIYCEGNPTPSPSNQEQGLDAQVYNQVFAEEFQDTIFVSSGGGNEPHKNAAVALAILGKVFDNVMLYVLKDRDTMAPAERQAFLNLDKSNRMLVRREIENYLFDEEVLADYCTANNRIFNRQVYQAIVTDIVDQDLKLIIYKLQQLCGMQGPANVFKLTLASHIRSHIAVYQELKRCIF